MSLVMAGALGVYRDLTDPSESISITGHSAATTNTATFSQLVVAQIPAEALVAYTTLLAVFSASGNGYRTGRWVLYGVSLPICAAVVLSSYLASHQALVGGSGRSPRRVPWLPMTTAVVAMACYGLTVPGSALQLSMSGTGFAIAAGCLSVGGGVVMSIFAPFLGRGNRVTAAPAQSAQPG